MVLCEHIKTRVSLRSPKELAHEPWLERKVDADYKIGQEEKRR